MDILISRLKNFAGNYIFLLIYMLLTVYVVLLFINRKNKVNLTNIVYLLISLIPLIWFVVLKNHSTVHAFFSYRNLCIVIYSLLIGIFIQDNSIYESKEK